MISYQSVADKSHFACLSLAIITGIAAPISTVVTSIGCIAVAVTLLLSGRLWQTLKISWQQPAGKMIVIFYLWLLIGTLYASNVGWSEKLYTLSSWKKLAYTFILLGLFYQEKWKRYFVNAYLLVMIPAAFAAVIFWVLEIEIREGPSWPYGVFMSNYTSQSMAFIAACIASLFLLMRTESKSMRYLLMLAIAAFIFNVYFVCGGRSAYIALPIVLVFVVANLCGLKRLPVIIAAVALLMSAIVFSSSSLQQRVQEGLNEVASYQDSPHLTSIGIRMIFAKHTLELIADKPVLGHGSGAFKIAYANNIAGRYNDWRETVTTDPHNIYLFVTTENGIVGLLIFLGYIVLAMRQGMLQSPYGAMGAAFLLAVSITSLFNSHFKTFPEGHLLAYFTGILLACYKQPSMKKTADA